MYRDAKDKKSTTNTRARARASNPKTRRPAWPGSRSESLMNEPCQPSARRPHSNLKICGWSCSLQASLYGVKLKWGMRKDGAIHSVLSNVYSPLSLFPVIYTFVLGILGVKGVKVCKYFRTIVIQDAQMERARYRHSLGLVESKMRPS